MKVADVISGREGPAGVRWLLGGRQPRAALFGVLRAMLARPATLRACQVTRAKYRTNRKLTATFDVSLREPETASERVRPVVVTWSGRDHRDPPMNESSARLLAEALQRGASAPFRELAAEVPAWDMRVRVAPLDEQFPQLVRLSDPCYAREALGGPGTPQVHWIRYWPGQRHVLRYDLLTGGRSSSSFVKIYAGETGRRAYEDAVRTCDWLAACGPGLLSVRPLAYLAADTALLFPRAAGTPLSAYLERPYPGLPWLLERAGAALRTLQNAPPSLAGGGERRNLAAQMEAIRRSAQHSAAVMGSRGEALRRLLDQARQVEERIGREPDVFAHGDFKADHLHVTSRGFTLIDFDNRCLAEPAYDAGKFLADLQWWFSERGPASVEQAQGHFLAGYAPGPDRLARMRLWESVLLAHLSIHRLALFRGDWDTRLESMLGRASAALNRISTGAGKA